jgi:hypothetical protein
VRVPQLPRQGRIGSNLIRTQIRRTSLTASVPAAFTERTPSSNTKNESSTHKTSNRQRPLAFGDALGGAVALISHHPQYGARDCVVRPQFERLTQAGLGAAWLAMKPPGRSLEPIERPGRSPRAEERPGQSPSGPMERPGEASGPGSGPSEASVQRAVRRSLRARGAPRDWRPRLLPNRRTFAPPAWQCHRRRASCGFRVQSQRRQVAWSVRPASYRS